MIILLVFKTNWGSFPPWGGGSWENLISRRGGRKGGRSLVTHPSTREGRTPNLRGVEVGCRKTLLPHVEMIFPIAKLISQTRKA